MIFLMAGLFNHSPIKPPAAARNQTLHPIVLKSKIPQGAVVGLSPEWRKEGLMRYRLFLITLIVPIRGCVHAPHTRSARSD